MEKTQKNKAKEPENNAGSDEEKSPPAQEGVSVYADPPKDSVEGTESENLPEKAAHGWPLEADRLAVKSSLVECLQVMAGHYGRRCSVTSLTAGLPIPPVGITPSLFVRAAERVDLQAKLVQRTLSSLAIAPNLPCVLALAHNQACIVWDVRHPKGHSPKEQAENKKKQNEIEVHPETRFLIQFAETSDEKQVMTLKDIEPLYTGYAFFIRPKARVDNRAGPAEINTGRDWFWATFWENKTLYTEVAVAAIMINMFGLASSIFIMNVYDRVVPNSAFDTLYAMSLGIFIVFIFDFILRNLRAHFLDHAGRRADIKMSAMLFEQILGMTMIARPPSAGILASNMKEFETLRDFFTSATMTALIDLPFVFFFIAVIAMIGGPVAFVPLAAIPLIVGMGFYLQKPMQKITKQSMNESALKNALLFETIIGLETIKVQAAEGHTQRNWEELTDKASKTAVKSRQLSAFAQHWAAFIQQLASVGIIIVGVFMISEGLITMGALIACVMLSGRVMGPLAQLAGLMTRLSQSRETLNQLDDLMKKPVERPTDKHFVSLGHVDGKVEFKDVTFSYPGQTTPSLTSLSFAIQKGERVGIIGAVGSGKTTIERLLINLYEPTAGSVQIDGTDVRQINPGDLRRTVGAVQQSPQLFFGSVRDNITMGHETAPDSAVMKAAELSGVMEFLRDSTAGLGTLVGERGEALSGGQRQAVAIARALLYDPPILVLDEPTASMDPASESRLRKRLEKLCENKTTILITHKGAMLGLVDKLILLDRGRIIAYGPKDEVIRKLQAREYGTAAEKTDV